MDLADFQFLMSYIESAAALSLGFSISETFRSKARRLFDVTANAWMKIQEADEQKIKKSKESGPTAAEVTTKRLISEARARCLIIEDRYARRAAYFGALMVAFLASISLLPLPILVGNKSYLVLSYMVIFLIVTLVHFSTLYFYFRLKNKWNEEKDNIKSSAEAQTSSDFDLRLKEYPDLYAQLKIDI